MKKHCKDCSCDTTGHCSCSCNHPHALIAILLLLLGIIPGIIYITIKCTEYGLVDPTSSIETKE